MAATIEKLSSNKVKLSFTVEASKLDEGIHKAYLKNVKSISIPGFRKGHAPQQVIESYYGKNVFLEDAFDMIFPDVYQAAIDEFKLNPVDRPEKLNMTQIEKGKDIIFDFEVFVKPEFTLGQYKNLGIVKTVEEVTEDDVKAEVERARDRASRYIDISDRPAQNDDRTNIDYAGYCEGVQFDGGTAQGQTLVLGSGSFIPGFEEQVVGMNIGEEKDIEVKFPDEYHAENLKGKPATFHVKLNGIQAKEIPAFDEDFVKEASETANTVEEYKAELKAKLEKDKDEKAEAQLENDILEKIIENTEIEVPDGMINEQIDNMLRDMEMRLMYQGMRLDDYFKYTGQTREQVSEMYKPEAEKRVRTQLCLEAIKNAENIEATEEEIDEQMKSFAENSRKSLDEFKATLSDNDKDYFKEIASITKTLTFLKANAE